VILNLAGKKWDWEWLNRVVKWASMDNVEDNLERFVTIIKYAVPLVLCYIFVERPVRFALGIGAILLVSSVYQESKSKTFLRTRSFFGILHIDDHVEDSYNRVHYYRLMHGTTTHGTQRMLSLPDGGDYVAAYLSALGSDSPLTLPIADAIWRDEQREPRTYYHRHGPIGRIMTVAHDKGKRPHLAFIGLGT